MNQQREKSRRRRFTFGIMALGLVATMFWVRFVWISLQKPPHLEEIAKAYGSVSMFYGIPEPDNTGKKIAFVKTSEKGYAAYVSDTATGNMILACEENALGPWGHDYDLHVWPWVPDSSAFVYSRKGKIVFGDPTTGKDTAEVPEPIALASLVWLSTNRFAFLGTDDSFYEFNKRSDGAWISRNVPDTASASSENVPSESAAKAFDELRTTKWYNNNREGPWWLCYTFGQARTFAVSEYTLTSADDEPGRDPKDWELQASNDKANWTILDSRKGQVFESRLQSKSYQTTNVTAYRSYRLMILGKASSKDNNVQLCKLSLKATNSQGKLVNVSLLENPFTGAKSLIALSSNTVAWIRENHLFTMNVDNRVVQDCVDAGKAFSSNTTIDSLCYSARTGDILLNCNQGSYHKLYRFAMAGGECVTRVETSISLENVVWFKNGSREGLVGLKQGSLLTKNGQSEREKLIPNANVTTFKVTADGNSLFFIGSVSSQPSDGIWRLDLNSGQISNVIPCGRYSSRFAKAIHPINDFILSKSGKYTIYLPADYYKHPNREYPLVIGDTDFGMVVGGGHGRLWLPAMAACNAFVLVVNRASWMEGLDMWGKDVTEAYNHLSSFVHVDKSRVFLFGASAETTYLSKLLADSPKKWRGAILLNPTGLPDIGSISKGWRPPRILISLGGLEGLDEKIKNYQQDAEANGIYVYLSIAPGEKHHFVGNNSQIQRTEAIAQLVFE